MTREELYQKHIDSMFGTKNVDKFTPQEVDEVLDNLLKCIPNDGKLYKYRKIDDDISFQYVYNSLKNGTLWSSRVDRFPDKTDCTICFDPSKEFDRIEKVLRDNPRLILRKIFSGVSRDMLKDICTLDDSILFRVVDCFDYEKKVVDETKILKLFCEYGCDVNQGRHIVNWIKESTEHILKEKEALIYEIADNFINFNQKMRRLAFVCSLCEDYRVKTMWEHYAGNQGICIEYDYKKLKTFSYKQKEFFCSTYKIRYVEEYEEQTFVPLVKEYLESDSKKSKNSELNKQLLLCLVTKTNDYAYEKEWRIFHYYWHDENDGFEINADLVTGIIFDEEALSTEHGRKILALCEQRGWNILVRKLNLTSTNYCFVPYKEYLETNDSSN